LLRPGACINPQPPSNSTVDIRHRKPLWGFGPIGWAAAAVLTAMLIALARGWDPVYTGAWILMRVSDGTMDGWMRTWACVWAFPSMATLRVTFGLIGLLYASVAFFIFPRRLPILPIVLLWAVVALDAFGWGVFPKNLQSRIPVQAFTFFPVLAATAECGLLLWITRRWWCAVPLLLPLFWNAAIEPSKILVWADQREVALVAHIVMGVPLLAWAIAARAKPAPPGKPCPKCDYDLTGLADTIPCAECGRVPVPVA
jgi:hypothetical protein